MCHPNISLPYLPVSFLLYLTFANVSFPVRVRISFFSFFFSSFAHFVKKTFVKSSSFYNKLDSMTTGHYITIFTSTILIGHMLRDKMQINSLRFVTSFTVYSVHTSHHILRRFRISICLPLLCQCC